MAITKYTSTKSFRNAYRLFVIMTAVAILALAFTFNTTSNAAAADITCGSSTHAGTATVQFNQDEATKGYIWIQLSLTKSQNIDADLNGNQCNNLTFTKMASEVTWQKFSKEFDFVKGTNEVRFRVFDSGVTLYKIAIVTDGQTPTGDGSNVTTVVTPTTSTTTTKPTVTTTTQAGGTTTKVTTTTTTLPATSTTKATTTSTTQPDVTTTQPGTTTTKVATTTTQAGGTTTTVPVSTAVTTTQPSSSTTVIVNPTTAPTTAPSVTVLGTSVTQKTAVSNANESLPFTGSSSRMMLIVALSAMLAGLVAIGISKKYLTRA